MSKTVGLIIASGFAIFWILKNLKGFFAKPLPEQGVETGVRRANYFLIGLFFLMGPFCIAMGFDQLVTEIHHQLDWVPAKGFVTEHIPSRIYKGRQQYRARFHFRTSKETGEVDHEVLDSNSQSRPPDVAREINVLYDPSNPDVAIIDDPVARWFLASVLLFLGGLFLILGGGGALEVSRLQSLRSLTRPSPQNGPGDGKLIAVKRSWFLSMKHAPCYRLIVSYQDLAGRKHVTASEPVWIVNPDTWAKKEVDVPLTLDRVDPSRAWVRVADYYRSCKNG